MSGTPILTPANITDKECLTVYLLQIFLACPHNIQKGTYVHAADSFVRELE